MLPYGMNGTRLKPARPTPRTPKNFFDPATARGRVGASTRSAPPSHRTSRRGKFAHSRADSLSRDNDANALAPIASINVWTSIRCRRPAPAEAPAASISDGMAIHDVRGPVGPSPSGSPKACRRAACRSGARKNAASPSARWTARVAGSQKRRRPQKRPSALHDGNRRQWSSFSICSA